MKILVTVKRVLDYNLKPKLSTDQTQVDLTSLKMSMNPFCEIAVEEAVRLKENGLAKEVVAVSIGGEKAVDQLRQAMALGADRAIHIHTAQEHNPLTIARLLKAIGEKEKPDLYILGKQSIDTDNNQVGQMLAGLLQISQATFASAVKIKEDKLEVTREVDNGLQTLELKLPAVITTDLRLNAPRYAKLPNIMKAKKKPIETLTPEDLEVGTTNTVKQLKVNLPEARKAGQTVADVDELIDKLKNEAKVLES